jgi:hypothetical protein
MQIQIYQMNNVTITIEYKIEYKFSNSHQWHSTKFSPDEYFDLDPDEKVEWDSVPFYNHTIDYLDIDKSLVQYTRNTIVDIEANVTQIFTETFWNQGENRITETIVSGSSSWKETIIEIKLDENPPKWEILRYKKENNLSMLSYHGLITDKEDGTQDEQIIFRS